MESLITHINSVTQRIIGCAIDVHREIGPGLFESTYETAMCIELHDAGLTFQRQVRIPVLYKGHKIGRYHLDLIVEDLVVVEIKSVEIPRDVHAAQVLSYMKAADLKVGLLINFNSRLLTQGVRRFVL